MKKSLLILMLCLGVAFGDNVTNNFTGQQTATGDQRSNVASTSGGGGCTPSYANTGATGNRTSIITITQSGVATQSGTSLVDGLFTTGRLFWNNKADLSDGTYFYQFNFGTPVTIDEAKYYQQNATDQGMWKWEGSNNGSTWTDIGGTFSLVTAATTTLTTLHGNTTAYQYYRLQSVSGSASDGPWIFQMEFRICPGL